MKYTNDNPVFMILIDAFAHSYISKECTPFIYSLLKQGKCATIEPMFAYRGIEATLFTGTTPNTHKIWTEFYFDESSKECMKSLIIRDAIMISEIIPTNYLSRILRYTFRKSMIPATMLKHFKKSVPHITDPQSLVVPTIFDILRENNRTFKFLTPSATRNDQKIFEMTDNLLETDKYDFWFIKFGTLDLMGHKYGPDILKLGKTLNDTDKFIEKTYLKFHKKYKNGLFLILSDHGMNEVEKIVNPIEIFSHVDFKVPKDYIYFIDSTMIRFWFFNEKAKMQILDLLSKIKTGRVLNKSELESLGIDSVGQRYGEIIFALKNKYVFFPDFFRLKSPPKGMHGYPFETSKPILILANDFNQKIKNHVNFIDLMPTLLELLNLDSSYHCEGESIWEEK